MHEHSLMNNLMSKILSLAEKENAVQITKISVKLGALSHMSPEHFREHFDIAAKALKTLGVTKVRLITNNPDKVEALRSAGIETERVTAWTVERPENSAYLAAKRAKMGHIL